MKTTFPVTFSVASTQAIIDEVLPCYELGKVADCKLQFVGVNDTFKVTLANGETYYLRVYRSHWRSYDNVAYEMDILNHLHRKSISVAHPVPMKDSSFIKVINLPEGPRCLVLFTTAVGKEPDYDIDPEIKAHAYGQAVARLHQASDDFTSTYSRVPLDIDFLYRQTIEPVRPYLLHRPADWDFLQAYADKFFQRLSAWPPSALDQGFCHADLQSCHAHVDSAGRMTFFDFDCCGPGFRAYDLAVFRWVSRLKEKEAIWWEPYLQGYQEVRPLRDLDIQSIPWFVAGRYLWHVWLHTTNAGDWGHGWLDDTYFDRLLTNLRAVETDYSLLK
jgi:Ser/Thr protein kinase RdoA (MazF antagonist)